MRPLFASIALLALAGCNDATPTTTDADPGREDPVFGRWTPVDVNDCDRVVVTIGPDDFGANVAGAPQPFSIGRDNRVERTRPGFVDVVYHPTTYDGDQRPIGSAAWTETVRFQVIDDDHLRGVGHIARGATDIGPLPLESAGVLDIRRCPASPAQP